MVITMTGRRIFVEILLKRFIDFSILRGRVPCSFRFRGTQLCTGKRIVTYNNALVNALSFTEQSDVCVKTLWTTFSSLQMLLLGDFVWLCLRKNRRHKCYISRAFAVASFTINVSRSNRGSLRLSPFRSRSSWSSQCGNFAPRCLPR